MSSSLRVGSFDANGQAVSTSSVEPVAGTGRVQRLLNRQHQHQLQQHQLQPEYRALVANPKPIGVRHSPSNVRRFRDRWGNSTNPTLLSGERRRRRTSTLTVIENAPGMVQEENYYYGQTPTSSSSSSQTPSGGGDGGVERYRPSGSPPPQHIATPQLLQTTGVQRRRSHAVVAVGGGGVSRASADAGGGSSSQSHQTAHLANANANANDGYFLFAGEEEEEASSPPEGVRVVPATESPAPIQPMSDHLIEAFEQARKLLMENAGPSTPALNGGNGGGGGGGASAENGGSTKLQETLMVLEQATILDRLELQKRYKESLQRLEDKYGAEIHALRSEMERSKKIHKLAQRYHLGRLKEQKEQMHTLEQSIAVLRKRNTDLANLVRQRHRPPESHGSHSRSASASAASVSAGLSSGHHHDETGPLAQNNLLTDPSLALSRSASSQENASSYVEDDGDMRVGDRAASSNHMQETAHSGMDSFSNNNNNNNSDPSDDIVDVEVETLLCPITQEAFEDPVVAADGHTYERGGILQWLEKHDTSPLTGAQLSSKQLFTNWTLRSILADYKSKFLARHRATLATAVSAAAEATPTSSSFAEVSNSNGDGRRVEQCAQGDTTKDDDDDDDGNTAHGAGATSSGPETSAWQEAAAALVQDRDGAATTNSTTRMSSYRRALSLDDGTGSQTCVIS